MTIFEAVKSTVTPRMAAEHFGLSVSQNGIWYAVPFTMTGTRA